MSEVILLAKSIEIDSQQKTIVQLSDSLARITIESRDLHTAFRQSQEDHLKKIEELSSANVSLVVSHNEVHAQLTVEQERIRDMEETITDLRHEKDRQEIIANYIFSEIKGGSSIFQLPSHPSLPKKTRKADLHMCTDGQTLSGMIPYIDDMYQQLDNTELRQVLKE